MKQTRVSSPPQSPPKATPPPKQEPAKAAPVPNEKAAADEEKNKGNAAYKARNFDEAIAHYEKAWETYKDITYLNNLSAACFEKGDYERSIAEATKAVEEGREIRADFKLIAK
jgi:stress-induced-phosphoprotein 1